MKKKIILIAIIASLAQNIKANDREDLRYIYMLFQNKEYQLSIDELERFIVRYPSSENYNTAQNILAQSYYHTNDYTNAKRRYTALLNTNFRDEANYYLALISISEGEYEKAENSMLNISIGSPYRPVALYRLAITMYSNNKIDEATRHFNRIRREKGPYENQALFNLGLIYYNQKDYFRSAVFLEEYLSKERNDFEKMSASTYMLGFCYYQVEDLQQAIKYYQNIENNFFTSSYYNRSLRDLLFVYTNQDKVEEMNSYTSKLLNTEFEELALQNTGNYYYRKNDFKSAETYYVQLLEKYRNIDVTYLLGRTQLSLGNNEGALANFKKLKDEAKYKNEYYYYVSFVLYQNKNYVEITKLLDSIEKKGISKEFEKQLFEFIGESAFVLKDYPLARKYFEFVYNNDKSINNLYKLMVINGKLGDAISVGNLLNTYNKDFPRDREFRKDIYLISGNLFVEKGDLAKGEEIYRDFLSKQSDDTITENLVTVLTRRGKYDELINYLDKLDPNPENIYLKGISYLGLSNLVEAEKVFNYLVYTDNKDITKHLKEKATVKLIETVFASKDYKKTLKFIELYEKEKYQFSLGEIQNIKALSHFRLGNYQNARLIYEKDLTNKEKEDFAKFMIAESYYNEKNYAKAREFYVDLYRSTKDKQYAKESAYWLIRIENLEGNYQRVESRVKGFRTEFPNSEFEEDIAYILANAYILNEEKQKAIDEYVALHDNTNNPSIKLQSSKLLTELYFNEGNTAKALEWNDKVKDEGFRNLWSGMINEKSDKESDAIKFYEKIEKDKTYGDMANFKLSSIYLKQKKYDLARKYAENVLEFESSSVKDKAQYNIGLSFEGEENYTRAISSFMRIRLLYTESSIQDLALVKIAENYEKSGNTEKAIETYREFFNTYKKSQDYQYVVEKLLIYNINSENMDVAKTYYNELRRINANHAKQYEAYIGG